MNRFALGLLLRIAALTLTGFGSGWAVAGTAAPGPGFWLTVGMLAATGQAVALYRYLTGVNRKLTRFLESVQYADFSSTFRADNGLGPSFGQLNARFNAVLDAFRQLRAEGEASHQFLQTIVQQLSVGVLVVDSAGRVELVNQAALRLLGLYRLRQLSELQTAHPALLPLLGPDPAPDPVVYRTPARLELSVRRTTVRLRGRLLTVVSLQNIQPELQQKELEAWQNLTRVLRHEIMNSITPIVSLTGTIRTILDTDLFPPTDSLSSPSSLSSLSFLSSPSSPSSPLDDLHLALTTIESRGQGIMRFVDAYRHFTTLPLPSRSRVAVSAVLGSVVALVRPEALRRQIDLWVSEPVEPLWLLADAGQIEMVLLNLLGNALDSLTDCPEPGITLSAVAGQGRVCIAVADNGPGITAEAMAKIFIPFFTTKPSGSGIGLSLSRQIMQVHGGQLLVESVPGQGSVFTLVFTD